MEINVSKPYDQWNLFMHFSMDDNIMKFRTYWYPIIKEKTQTDMASLN